MDVDYSKPMIFCIFLLVFIEAFQHTNKNSNKVYKECVEKRVFDLTKIQQLKQEKLLEVCAIEDKNYLLITFKR